MPPPSLTRAEARAAALLLLGGLAWLLLAGRPRPVPWPGAPLRVEVNRASTAELCAVPGIGPTLAARIVGGRPWRDRARLATLLGAGVWARAGPYLSLDAPAPLSGPAGGPPPAAPAGCEGSAPDPPDRPGSGTWPR